MPLSTEALAVIGEARRHARDGFLFPSPKRGVISDMTMSRLMEARQVETLGRMAFGRASGTGSPRRSIRRTTLPGDRARSYRRRRGRALL